MTNEQRGVYVQIINVIYDRGACPDDDEYLKAVTGLHLRVLRRVKKELLDSGKVIKVGANLEQTRAKLERKEAETFIENQRNRALKRWKNNGLANANTGNANHNHNHSSKTQSPSTQPETLLPPQTQKDSLFELAPPQGGNGHTKPRKKVARSIPDDWAPDVEFARGKGLSDREINLQANKLVDWAKANDKRYCDWVAVWRNWIRSFVERRDGTGLH